MPTKGSYKVGQNSATTVHKHDIFSLLKLTFFFSKTSVRMIDSREKCDHWLSHDAERHVKRTVKNRNSFDMALTVLSLFFACLCS